MLEKLFSQLAAVPPVPSVKNQREPLQSTDYAAVPWVPPVPSQKTKVKTETDKFLYWRIVRNGQATHIHMIPPHTLDEMRHIYRGADAIEPVESLHEDRTA